MPIKWSKTELSESVPGVFRALPMDPEKGYWMGYFIEVIFASDSGLKQDYEFSTPGQVWPNTLPF